MAAGKRSLNSLTQRTAIVPVFLSLAAAFALPAAAQTDPQAPSDIIVTGQVPTTPKQVDKEAHRITERVDPYTESLPRFETTVCPAAVGVPPDFATAIVKRLRLDAEVAGVSVAKPGCTANLAVIFVKNGQAEIRAIRNRRINLFAGLSSSDIGRLVNDPGPVHAWMRSQRTGRDGQPLDYEPNEPAPRLAVTPSLILLTTRLETYAAVVVIDLPAADGMTTDQLADYAAMRTLARTRTVGAGESVDTILALFDTPAGKRPAEMTTFDLGYLRALYRTTAGQPAYMTLGGVTDAVRKASKQASEESPPKR